MKCVCESFGAAGEAKAVRQTQRMHSTLKKIGPALREVGFRGSGQNYRKADGDFVFVINFQGSRWGDNFYVNLGAQPVFIPAEGNADLVKLKEYECMLRKRVGNDWPWEMSDETFASLQTEIISAQAAFFDHARTLRKALEMDAPETLLRNFASGTTEARATLHLSRAAAAFSCDLDISGARQFAPSPAFPATPKLDSSKGKSPDSADLPPHPP